MLSELNHPPHQTLRERFQRLSLMAQVLSVLLVSAAAGLVGINAFFILAHLVHREKAARTVARALSRYVRFLRLGESDYRSPPHEKHA